MVEPDWHDKYREALSRLAEEDARWARVQNVLKLLIGRLCLAARGRNERLDQEIARIADVARQDLDADALEALLAPLSAAIATLDGSGEAAAAGNVGAAAASDATTHDTLGATAVLDRLALLPELKPAVNDLRARKRDTLNLHEMAELLERVTRYATEQRAQVQREKLELESLVQQTASRLEEITSHLASELDERNAGQRDADLLNKNVTDEVAQLRSSAERAPDLQTLRSQLTARLDAIGKHFSEFRTREDARLRSYRERVQHMRARIAVLERESRSLHESLREEQRLAMIDALTGIPNRAAYDDRIEQEFKRWKRFTRPVSILAWDIDRFKAINDAYGHKAGDKVLRV
ncbi:MAG TPA: diguanylate cyclase, partial [Steroidobacteraceae bacterium]|nr:diguanylate cyclase [Steroidobacteraceae bacterium]